MRRYFGNKFIIAGLFLCILGVYKIPVCNAGDAQSVYSVQAAFIFNFCNFTKWPDEAVKRKRKFQQDKTSNQIQIGIIGQESFGALWDKPSIKKKIHVNRFKGFKQLEDQSVKKALQHCYAVYICPSELLHYQEIIECLSGYNVLTIGNDYEFLKAGGMIAFVLQAKRVRFEIGLRQVKKEKLHISSKVLRLAKEVYKKRIK